MPTLHLAFEDGFDDDTVVVRVDGREVTRRIGLRSSLATALAATEDAQVGSGAGEVAVAVSSRGLTATRKVDFTAEPHLAIAIRDGALVLRTSREPFVYM